MPFNFEMFCSLHMDTPSISFIRSALKIIKSKFHPRLKIMFSNYSVSITYSHFLFVFQLPKKKRTWEKIVNIFCEVWNDENAPLKSNNAFLVTQFKFLFLITVIEYFKST